MDVGDWIALGLALVALGAAGVSVRQAKTARMQVTVARDHLEHAKQVQREQKEPYVIVDIQPHDPSSGVLVLAIENIGPTVARNVRVTADPPLASGWGNLTEMLQRAISRTIPMLPPGRRIVYLLDNQDRFTSGLPTAYTFTVQSEGPYGPVEVLEYTVDFSTWAESLMGQRPTKHLEDKLSKLHSELKALSENYKLANGARIRDEREHTQKVRHEQMEQRRKRNQPPDAHAV